MQIKKLALMNAISLGVHLLSAFFIQLKLVNKWNVGDVSDQYHSLFTPHGSTFLIWGLIYIALIAFCCYHLAKAYHEPENHPANIALVKLRGLFIINNLATAFWLFAWINRLFGLSVILIFLQLATLIMMNLRLRIHKADTNLASKVFTQFPLSIYFGWITIATIANTSVWLVSINWDGWGMSETNWAITMIAVAVMITVWLINHKCNVTFGAVVVWALYGIIKKLNTDDPINFHPVIVVAWGGIAIVSSAMLFGLARNLRAYRKYLKKKKSKAHTA